jgi:MFS family permease
MRELRPLLLANLLCLAAMMSFVPLVGPLVRELGLAEWHGGVVAAVAGLLWMLLAGPWGRASDVRGRKPVLLLGIAGFAVGYLLLAVFLDVALTKQLGVFVTVLLLALTRSVIGAFYAAIPPVSAALAADHSQPETRAAAMASLGAANAIGMVLGPLIGGLLANFSLVLPMYASALLPLLALFFVWRALPKAPAYAPQAMPKARFFDPRLRLPQAGAFLAMTGVITAQMCAGFYAIDRLALDAAGSARVAGYAMAAVGVTLIFAQITVSRLPRIALHHWLISGALIAAFGLGFVTMTGRALSLIASYCIVAAGMGLLFPALQALAANSVSPTEQGMAAGSVSAAQGTASVTIPVICTLLYQVQPELPYLAASVMLLLLAALAFLRSDDKRPPDHA